MEDADDLLGSSRSGDLKFSPSDSGTTTRTGERWGVVWLLSLRSPTVGQGEQSLLAHGWGAGHLERGHRWGREGGCGNTVTGTRKSSSG